MNKARILSIVGFLLIIPLAAEGRMGLGSGSGSVPRVVYEKPQSQSVIDVSGNKGIVFEWARVPIPSNGRDSYRFVLYKGEGYDLVADQLLDPRTFSIEVPADKLENGMKYWWYVKQRDEITMQWSEYDIWYFSVVKHD